MAVLHDRGNVLDFVLPCCSFSFTQAVLVLIGLIIHVSVGMGGLGTVVALGVLGEGVVVLGGREVVLGSVALVGLGGGVIVVGGIVILGLMVVMIGGIGVVVIGGIRVIMIGGIGVVVIGFVIGRP